VAFSIVGEEGGFEMEQLENARQKKEALRKKYYVCAGCGKVFDRGTHECVKVEPTFTESSSTCPTCFAEKTVGSPRMNAWTEETLKRVFGLPQEKAKELVNLYTKKKVG